MAEQFKDGLEHLPLAERVTLRAKNVADLAAQMTGVISPSDEIERLRREVEFEANGERWERAIVGREGHEYINGGCACACGEPCPSLDYWERHLRQTRIDEGKPLCACPTEEQLLRLGSGFTRPQCGVHPENGGE